MDEGKPFLGFFLLRNYMAAITKSMCLGKSIPIGELVLYIKLTAIFMEKFFKSRRTFGEIGRINN